MPVQSFIKDPSLSTFQPNAAPSGTPGAPPPHVGMDFDLNDPRYDPPGDGLIDGGPPIDTLREATGKEVIYAAAGRKGPGGKGSKMPVVLFGVGAAVLVLGIGMVIWSQQ